MLVRNEECRVSPLTDSCLDVLKELCSDFGVCGAPQWKLALPRFVDGSVVEQIPNPDMNSCPWPSLDFACSTVKLLQ